MIRQVASVMDNLIDRRVDRRGYALEVVVVLLCGALGSIGFAYMWMEVNEALDDVATMMTYNLLAEVLMPIIMLFGLWIFYTVGAHFLSGHFNGRGPIIRLFRTSAWAIVPLGIWYAIRSAVVVYLFWDADLPADPDGLGAEEQLQTLLEVALETPIYAGTLLLGVLFTVWSGYLLSVGIQRSKNLPAADARKIAAILSGVFALYLLWRALYWGGIV